MATSGEMVSAVAQAMGVPVAKVETLDRRLSEHGLRTKGGRGRSAAHMTALDVANLTFAVMSGAGMTEAPASTEKMTKLSRVMTSVRLKPNSDDMVRNLAEGTDWHFPEPSELNHFSLGASLNSVATFGEAVALMVDAMAADQLKLSEDTVLTLMFTNDGPAASLTFQVRENVLRVLFGASAADREKPVVKQKFELDGTVLEQVAHLIITI